MDDVPVEIAQNHGCLFHLSDVGQIVSNCFNCPLQVAQLRVSYSGEVGRWLSGVSFGTARWPVGFSCVS